MKNVREFFSDLVDFRGGSKEGNIVRGIIIFLALMFCIIAKCSCETTDCMETTALRYTGIREQGANRGKLIDYALDKCGLEGTASAYCGATNYALHVDCGIPAANLPDAPCWAPSWGNKIVWRNGQAPDVIQKGMTVLFWYASKGRIGHVGIVVYKSSDGRGDYLACFSGNTRDPLNSWNPGEGFHIVKIYLVSVYAISDYVSSATISITKYHIVKPKETLYRLSVMYSVSVDDLRKWNNIADNGIWIGQELKVSA